MIKEMGLRNKDALSREKRQLRIWTVKRNEWSWPPPLTGYHRVILDVIKMMILDITVSPWV